MARVPGGIKMGRSGLEGQKGVQGGLKRVGKTGSGRAAANFGDAMGQVAMAAARVKQRNMSAKNRAAYGVPDKKPMKFTPKTRAKMISRGARKGVVVLGSGG